MEEKLFPLEHLNILSPVVGFGGDFLGYLVLGVGLSLSLFHQKNLNIESTSRRMVCHWGNAATPKGYLGCLGLGLRCPVQTAGALCRGRALLVGTCVLPGVGFLRPSGEALKMRGGRVMSVNTHSPFTVPRGGEWTRM